MAMRQFKAESKKLLDLMINSIYTNREIFLRELISNASDACDKRYFKSLTDTSVGITKDDLKIHIQPDKESRTLTISDNGIGMTKDELEKNLGTIAKSGSFDFKTENQSDNIDIIGQFGVGFYSAFMVAKEVTVESKTWGDEPAAMWHSDGTDGYTISESDRTKPGTKITLVLRDNTEEENYDEFLDPYLLKSLVKRYSDYIRYPIVMLMEKQRMKEGTEEHPEYETYYEDETLNSMVPLWRKNKNELSDEDYENFYHERRFGFDKPLRHLHLNAEGAALSYRAILYIPSQPPFDYYTNDYKRGLALYSNGVLIMDSCEDLLPEYYNFVKGVVDSEDLSLNISRELLQHDRQLATIRHKIDERITRELNQMRDNDREQYEEFFKAFGRHIKISLYNSYGALKDKLQDFLLFYSSTENKLVTLKEYVERMPEDQKYIYYAAGASADQIDSLPQVGIIKNKGYEMLYLTDAFDEFVLRTLGAYSEKEFRSVSGDDLGLEDDAEKSDDEKEADSAFFEKLAGLLSSEVVRVKATDLLADEDAVYLSTEGQISVDMEKLYAAMPNGGAIKAQKVLEINKNHPVYAKLEELYKAEDDDALKEYTNLLYQQARLIAGLPVEDPTAFARSMSAMMTK